MQTTNSTTSISHSEFNKKVDQEFAYLTYQDRMPEDKARAKALETVSQKFHIQKMN